MEQERRASRASSTSSLGREVRCGCQFYQSDSLLPERQVLLGRPPSRSAMQHPAAAVRCSEHEYEPIASPLPFPSAQVMAAPVVRITDTDVVRVADSDDSIDDRGALPPELALDGDVILPLDGRIEDSAMEARELVDTGDTSEELETAQQLQERLEERFLSSASTPGAESRTDGEVNTSQVDSLAMEELPLRRGARGLHQKIRTQAGKLRSRLRGIHRPTFTFADRKNPEKPRSASSGRSDKSRDRTEKRPSRIERLRSSLPERPKFKLPERPKFALPLTERSKFRLPERPKLSIKIPSALKKNGKHGNNGKKQPPSSKRNIFNFSTYPRLFDKKSKKRADYVTSSPKESRAQSAESATFPRTRKTRPLGTRWADRFGDLDLDDAGFDTENGADRESAAQRARPWRQPSLEEPRLSIRMEEEVLLAARGIPWDEARAKEGRRHLDEDEQELRYMDYDPESVETTEFHERHASETCRISRDAVRSQQKDSESMALDHEPEVDPRLYGDRVEVARRSKRASKHEKKPEDWQQEWIEAEAAGGLVRRSKSLGEEFDGKDADRSGYEASFGAVDPRRFGATGNNADIEQVEGSGKGDEEEGATGAAVVVVEEEEEEAEEAEEGEAEEDEDEDDEEEDEAEMDDTSAPSDKEQQQSSASSCDRRRRGVIEEIDSDEFYVRGSGISQGEIDLAKYLSGEIRGALSSDAKNALLNESLFPIPPQRPARTRSLRKSKQFGEHASDMTESEQREPSERSLDLLDKESSVSKHRVVYQTDGSSRDVSREEPLDDIVVVKPMRRKSKSSLTSSSQGPPLDVESSPPTAPTRRKRPLAQSRQALRDGAAVVCNGHDKWPSDRPSERIVAKREDDYVEPVPVPPKRRSRSRTASVAPDEDRTSHGAESLPEAGYVQEEIPHDETDLSGYAIVEKREKPPRPPPPRRKREKFATAPRPIVPKRPQRAYSTLGPAKSLDFDHAGQQRGSASAHAFGKMQGRPLPPPPRPPRSRRDSNSCQRVEHLGSEVSAATQTDPLPDDMVIEEEITQARLVVTPSLSGSQITVSTERIPSPTRMSTPPPQPQIPPIPPLPLAETIGRSKEDDIRRFVGSTDRASFSTGDLLATDAMTDRLGSRRQFTRSEEDTDRRGPLLAGEMEHADSITANLSTLPQEAPVRFEETPEARLSPSARRSETSGTQLADSTIRGLVESAGTPIEYPSEAGSLSVSVRSSGTSRIGCVDVRGESTTYEPTTGRPADSPTGDRPQSSSERQETMKIASLQVGDLIVDRLSVSQLEARKIVASEVDAVVISASEMKSLGVVAEDRYSPSIVKELIAIRSHLESSRAVEFLPQGGIAAPQPGAAAERAKMPPDAKDKVNNEESDALATHNLVPVEPEISTTHSQDVPAGSPQCLRSDTFLSPGVKNGADSEATAVSEPPRAEPAAPLAGTVGRAANGNGNDEQTEGERKRKSRSRSPSPCRTSCSARQTASPVRQLPPVISVTPDTPDASAGTIATALAGFSQSQPQRAVISYSDPPQVKDELARSPITVFPAGGTHLIAFPASQMTDPAGQLSSLGQVRNPIAGMATATATATGTGMANGTGPGIADATQQLLTAFQVAATNVLRGFVRYLNNTIGREDSREKIREVELALCAAIVTLIACLFIVCFGSPQTVTHHHHWDYFNPPQ